MYNAGMGRPTHQHFVPRFYLKRFATADGRIGLLDLCTGSRRVVSVRDVAVAKDLYTVLDPSGSPSGDIERLLTEVEGKVAPLLAGMCRGALPAANFERFHLALFLALQMVRTPEFRTYVEELGDVLTKSRLASLSDAELAGLLRRQRGSEPAEDDVVRARAFVGRLDSITIRPNANARVRTMLTMAVNLAPLLVERSWFLLTSDKPRVFTSDTPVALARMIDGAPRAIMSGLGMADWVYLPMDPSHLLGLYRDSHLPDTALILKAQEVRAVNAVLVDSAYERVFFHPSHTEGVRQIQPRPRRPLFHINGAPVAPRAGWAVMRRQQAKQPAELKFSRLG